MDLVPILRVQFKHLQLPTYLGFYDLSCHKLFILNEIYKQNRCIANLNKNTIV